ncbi:MAG: PAS domain-containing protein [Methylobacillus sp.]|jgi:PAS domain S-box-containing protein|nr:PAS domain-containing protein [Methylobacillus sp.]
MSLYIFSIILLSLVFMLIFGTWWDSSAPFKIHVAALITVMAALLSTFVMVSIYPILSLRLPSGLRKKQLDNITWGRDVSANLATPAAVLDGYNLIFANRALLDELGMSGMSEQVIGMPLTNIVHPRDHHNLAKFIAGAAHSHQPNETLTARMLCHDGTTLPVQIALSPLRESGNSSLSLLQFSSQSGAYPATTSAGGQSDYHLLIDRIEQIVFHINAHQEIIFLNPSWEHLLDHSIRESINKPLISFAHPEDRPMVESHISSLTHGKRTSCHLQARFIAKNGNTFWVELRAKATSAHRGERTSVIGTMTDINRMKSTEASLYANRRSLSTLLSNIPGMVYRCKNDRNWSLEFASDGCLDVVGYEPYEMVNAPDFSFVQIIHPDDRQKTWEAVQHSVTDHTSFQLVYRIITRSGQVKWVWEQGRGVYSSTGDLLALEGFITDFATEGDTDMMMKFQDMLTSRALH